MTPTSVHDINQSTGRRCVRTAAELDLNFIQINEQIFQEEFIRLGLLHNHSDSKEAAAATAG